MEKESKNKNSEIIGRSRVNFDIAFPIRDGKEIKVKVDIESDMTSSIAAQEKLDELAEKQSNRRAEFIGKLFGSLMEKAPELKNIITEIGERVEEYRQRQCSNSWDVMIDELIYLLGTNDNILEKNIDYLKRIMKMNDDECNYETKCLAKWGITQYEKYSNNMLDNERSSIIKQLFILG